MSTALDRTSSGEDRRQRIRPPVLVAAAVMGASLLLHLRDPHQSGSWGLCPWLLLTGTSCPGCGGLRAVNDLTHGDIAAAASSNLLFVGSIPLVVFLWARWARDRWTGRSRVTDTRRAVVFSIAFATLAVIFWVLRNVPAGSWLAP